MSASRRQPEIASCFETRPRLHVASAHVLACTPQDEGGSRAVLRNYSLMTERSRVGEGALGAERGQNRTAPLPTLRSRPLMTTSLLELSIALSDNERTRPLIEGRVVPQGIKLLPTMVHPSEMFWRQLRFAEFDVSEMSMSSLIISVSRGDTRWVAIPVFTMRKFFHTSIIVRTDSGIAAPADLRGKRIGVPEYQQTWAIWSRGVLQHEFG